MVCPACPLVFERIATMAMADAETISDHQRNMAMGEALEKGYRYVYKIALIPKPGSVEIDSRLIEIVY